MENNILFHWNIKGACNLTARGNLRDFLHKHKTNNICIQETKCQRWTDLMKDLIWPVIGHCWINSPPHVQSGGLLLSWDSSLLSILQSSFPRHLIWIKVLLSGSINIFNIINLYAPPRNIRKTTALVRGQKILKSVSWRTFLCSRRFQLHRILQE